MSCLRARVMAMLGESSRGQWPLREAWERFGGLEAMGHNTDMRKRGGRGRL